MRRIRTSKASVAWIQGPGPTDLWTWIDAQGAISKQELTFFGRTILRESGKLMTGLCTEGVGAGYVGETGFISIDSKHDVDTMTGAYLVLDAVPQDLRADAGVVALKAAIRGELDARGLPEPVAKT